MPVYNVYVNIFHVSENLDPLLELGLERKEALVYLATLYLGSGTLSEIARKAQIERTGVYYHIEKLKALKLIKMATRGKRTLYLPSDPSLFRKILEHKKVSLEGIMPELENQFALKVSKPNVKYYQGEEDFPGFYDDMYAMFAEMEGTSGYVYILGHSNKVVHNYYEGMPTIQNYKPKERQLDVKLRSIMPKAEKDNKTKNIADPYMVTRFNLPPSENKFIEDKYEHISAIMLTNTKILTLDIHTLFASITENRNLAETWRNFLEFMWKSIPNK